jgi:hypothetical protein
MLQAEDARLRPQPGWVRRREEAHRWIARHCRRAGITPEAVRRGWRQPIACNSSFGGITGVAIGGSA